MKFYFDGELIRTSKAHRYTHAVVLPTKPGATNKWDVLGCRASLAMPRRCWHRNAAALPSTTKKQPTPCAW